MRKCCIITLRSVFVQGIQALDTLSPYIYYELLPILIIFLSKSNDNQSPIRYTDLAYNARILVSLHMYIHYSLKQSTITAFTKLKNKY